MSVRLVVYCTDGSGTVEYYAEVGEAVQRCTAVCHICPALSESMASMARYGVYGFCDLLWAKIMVC